MERRDFLKTSALTAAIPVSAWMTGCQPGEQPASQATNLNDFPLLEATAAQLQQWMTEGAYSAKDLAALYLKRIEEIDRSGPQLRSVIEINPEALSMAEQLDKERAEGKIRGPLHGIPVLIKDNIDTADQMKTSAGSLALAEHIAPTDSFIVQQLRQAGCVLLGKTNLSEWANFRSNRSSSGWSGRGGQTRNPYVLNRNPCGSSSGSGAAVSANLCAIAIGTETNGSIICPSTMNGVVGIKPTVGLWSRSGIIPISHTQDTAGPMARTVADAAALLGPLTGTDPKDAATAASESHRHTDYTQFLKADALKGARIGVARNFFGFRPEVDALMEQAIELIKAQGAEIVDPANIERTREYGGPEFTLLLYEFKHGLNQYLASAGKGAAIRTLEELIAWNKQNATQSMPYFGQDILERSQEKGDLNEAAYQEALAKVLELSREQGIDATLKTHQLDAIIAPSGGPAWTTDPVNGDHYGGGSSSPAAMAGYPNITVPMGFVHGLPVGISFIGMAWAEPTLIRLAYAYEQASKHRKAPEFLPAIGG